MSDTEEKKLRKIEKRKEGLGRRRRKALKVKKSEC